MKLVTLQMQILHQLINDGTPICFNHLAEHKYLKVAPHLLAD